MRILYYNWVQFDKLTQGGGVNIYQRNLIEYIVENTPAEVYFLSGGYYYDALSAKPYIRKTRNIFLDKCQTFEIVNSSIMAPALAIFMNPERFIDDSSSMNMLDQFLAEYGPFDAIHFNNMEGISVNVLGLKQKYPDTQFILSIHNYQPICPQVSYFQSHKACICDDFDSGQGCLSCLTRWPTRNEYYQRCLEFYEHRMSSPFLRRVLKFVCKRARRRWKSYMGTQETMKAELYLKYREHNIAMLNEYADVLLAVSDRVRHIMIRHGVLPNKIKTSYIGTKFAEHELRRSCSETTTPFTIAYIGYARIDKGYFFLLEALSRLDKKIAKGMIVVLAGKDIQKEHYVDKLSHFDHVIVHDGYSHEELQGILRHVNLGIVPVMWEDNLPQVAIEMVACGVPILCSEYGGASELCTSERFKFRGGDQQELIDKLSRLVVYPELLNEYWENHSGLQTMTKHWKELSKYYTGQSVDSM